MGVSKALVGFWRTGRKLPNPDMRRVLATLYDIPASSWDARLGGDAPSKPAPTPTPELVPASTSGVEVDIRARAVAENRAGVLRILADIQRRASSQDLSVLEFTRLVDAESRVRKLIHEMDQRDAMLESRIVRSVPMQRIRNRAIAALAAYPEALAAFVDALGVRP